MEWIMDNIYIVAPILFFLVSFLGRSGGQGKNQQPPNRVPQQEHESGGASYGETYSMDEDDDEDEEYSEYGETPSYEDRERRAVYPAKAKRELREPGYFSAEEINREMDARNRLMQKELEGMYAHLDQSSSGTRLVSDGDPDPEGTRSYGGNSRLAEQAVQGVIWSEILGPPRARKMMGRRR